MRRLVLLGLTAGAVAFVARLRAGARSPEVTTGVFPNGMAWARTGTGPRTVIAIPGGPGNAQPTLRAVGPALQGLLAEGHTCWAVTRRRGMPAGHSVADMADDVADLIAAEFGGRVDLVLGNSMGGMIGYHLAARHPDRLGRLAAVSAAAWTSDEGRAGDLAFARALADGRLGDASVAMLGVVAPHVPRPIARLLGPALAPLLVGDMHPTFASDVLVEGEACDRYDARPDLPAIAIPVLVVGGDQDRYFPLGHFEETARRIPGAELRIHRGQGHMRVLTSADAAREVVEFAVRA